MSFLTSIFRKKKEEDYETILSALALDIHKRQVRLSEIRLRERRSTLLVTLYTLAGWVAYISLWYTGLLPKRGGRAASGLERAVKAAPVIVGPIIILFVRRIVQIWYKRKGDAEEKTLQTLLKQQRAKVEEIKQKTNYYSTRDLIQRYDDSPSNPGLRQRLVPAPPPTQPSTPQRPPAPPNGQAVSMTPNPFSPQPPTPLPSNPPRKQWYDKLADAVLGDDDHTPNPSTSRYALICEKCFAHNGLVKESMWEDAQYICPKCGHFNRSVNSKKQARILTPSPSSTASTPLPVTA
ncbi:putative predicted integral membrane zinc-ribbon metal-binding protein [Lyophyllum shimeji]|uniref:Endoplasmic reticulum junction formation protein lunapark n=1 Tax=Lyophyllum shimeji TaxID=47721 RepID=A0A9P3PEH8_LYOSH|nr:putative predicted integral membrane zinc-ribbon metal-binding protein [Lyophyllum shimeji]